MLAEFPWNIHIKRILIAFFDNNNCLITLREGYKYGSGPIDIDSNTQLMTLSTRTKHSITIAMHAKHNLTIGLSRKWPKCDCVFTFKIVSVCQFLHDQSFVLFFQQWRSSLCTFSKNLLYFLCCKTTVLQMQCSTLFC